MSTEFAAAVRERAGLAWQALQAARGEGDTHAVLVAEAEWEDAWRLARVHGVAIEAHQPGTEGEAGA